MPATRHLFFALEPPPSLRAALALHVARLRAEWGGRASAPAKLHMTLLFLDAVADPLPSHVVGAARAAAASIRHPPMDITIDRADRFGKRIGWLGCSHVPDALQHLHDTLADTARAHDLPMRHEDRYAPHVTALRDPRTPVPHAIDPMPWHVDHFVLMASAEGAYEVLGSWPLRG